MSFSFIVLTLACLLLSSINYCMSLANGIHTTETPDMEIINGTNNFRVYAKKGNNEKPWVDNKDDMPCVRPAKCEKLTFDTCFDAKIPYSYTSLDLTDNFSQDQTLERLHNYKALRHVPKCWAVIQPFLCAVFVPKCERIKNKDMVYLPSLEVCKVTLEPCRVLFNTSYFPAFLKCNETLFPSKCNNDVREMKFNTTGKCIEPLVPAESSSSYYKGIEGCGVQCKDPLYTDDEHRQIHKLIAWGATLCLLCNLFVIITFVIDWQNTNKYPALIVFYINLCFFISCLGWLAQFTPGSREDIVCRKDGTLRHSEPSAGENLSCVVVFVLVYYFLTAAMVWFVFLTYAWHLRAMGNVQDRIDKNGFYFHAVAWSLPLVFTILTIFLSKVDGNSTVGVCFVGYMDHPIRAGLLLGPLCGVVLIGGYFIIRGMIKLFVLKKFSNNMKTTTTSNKIHLIIVRMGLCALFTFIFILVAITCHINEFQNSNLWIESLRIFIICKISMTYTDEHRICKIENRPSVAVLQLHLLSLYGAGIVLSSWCWTPASIETWKRYINKKCGKDVTEEIKMQKHKVIAQTWAKRKEFEAKGRLSISFHKTHTDPADLNFDLNDLNSSVNGISSTWANYLPHFVRRRYALTGAATNSSSYGQRNSSEISFSVRHVSVESRRNSVDSQVSVKIAEMKTKVARRTRNGSHNGKSTKTRNRRREFFAAGRKFNSRRESSTSVESQVIALKKTTYPGSNHKLGIFSHSKCGGGKNMKRRGASAGLVEPDISNFLSKNGKFIFPFLQNQGMTTTSDEEGSRSSIRIQDSRLDVVLRQHDLSNDEDNDDNCESRIRIDEYTQTDEETRKKKTKVNKHRTKKKEETDLNISDMNESLTSYSSELDLPTNIQSSYSGISGGKPNSRNSKTSCDVGIQTNAYEIATQTLSSFDCDDDDINDKMKNSLKRLNLKNRHVIKSDDDENCDITECHQLLPMSECEKLKMLLLPSK